MLLGEIKEGSRVVTQECMLIIAWQEVFIQITKVIKGQQSCRKALKGAFFLEDINYLSSFRKFRNLYKFREAWIILLIQLLKIQ